MTKNIEIRVKTCHRRFDNEPLSYAKEIYRLNRIAFKDAHKGTSNYTTLKETISAFKIYLKKRKK